MAEGLTICQGFFISCLFPPKLSQQRSVHMYCHVQWWGVVEVMVHMSWLCSGVFMMTCMVRRVLEGGPQWVVCHRELRRERGKGRES